MSSKSKECTTFEPQAWRRTLCKNCFRTKEQHGAPSSRPQTPTDSGSESGSRPPTPAVGISEPPTFPQVDTKAGQVGGSAIDNGVVSTGVADDAQVSGKPETMGDKLKKIGKGWLRGGGSVEGPKVNVTGIQDNDKKARTRAEGVRSPTPMPPVSTASPAAGPLGGVTSTTAPSTAANTGSSSSKDKNKPPLPTSSHVQTVTPTAVVTQAEVGTCVGAASAPASSAGLSSEVSSGRKAPLGGEKRGTGARTRIRVRAAAADVDGQKADSSPAASAAPTVAPQPQPQPQPQPAREQKQTRLSIQLSPPSSANTSPQPSPPQPGQPAAVHSKVNSQIGSRVEHSAIQEQTPSNLEQQPSGKSGQEELLGTVQGGGDAHRASSLVSQQPVTQPPDPSGHIRALLSDAAGQTSVQSWSSGDVSTVGHRQSSASRSSSSDLLSSPPCPPTSPGAVSPATANTPHLIPQQQYPHTDLSVETPTVHVPSLDIQTPAYREFATNNAHNLSPASYTSGHNLLQVKPTPDEGHQGDADYRSTVEYHNQYNNQYNNQFSNSSQGQSTPSKRQLQYHTPEETQTFSANSLFHHSPEDSKKNQDQSWGSHNSWNSPSRISGGGLVLQFEDDRQANKIELAKSSRRRRRLMSYDETDIQGHRRKMADLSMGLSRDEALMEGTRMIMDNLRDKLHIAEQRCEQMEREKSALAELLSVKKMEIANLEDESQCRIGELEDQVRRLSMEKSRLMDKLKLPESERSSLVDTENEIAILIKKLDEAEMKFDKSTEENEHLRHEIHDLHVEMDEMHDQFREDEAMEFREMQKDLEATAKNCRILQFKLRKSERRNEQLEHDQMQYEEKVRQLESRFETADDKQHIRELEEELRMAKEVSVRLHDELELVEERRARYEEELDRVNDILTESENRRQALQKELDQVHDQMAEMRSEQRAGGVQEKRLDVPGTKAPKLGSLSREGSKEVDIEQIMRDLSDSLERENDVKEQLKFAEEEARTMRKKMSDLEEENESLTMQLQKLSSAKSSKFFSKKKKDSVGEKEVVTEREHEMKIQMELAEQEVKVLRRKLDEMDSVHETLTSEIRALQAKVGTDGDVSTRGRSSSPDDRPYEERIESMAKDIDQLKWKLIEKDRGGAGGSVARMLQKSKSLETDTEVSGGKPSGEFQVDLKRQLETVQQEAKLLKEKFVKMENENERLISENKKLQLLSSRRLPSITTDDSAMQNIELKDKIKQLETENTSLREKVRTLDQRTSKLSKDVTKTQLSGDSATDTDKMRDQQAQIKTLEDENRTVRRKMADLEARNANLNRELKKYKKDEGDKPTQEFSKSLEKSSRMELKERIWELEGEIKDLLTVIRNREEENERLEEEISVLQTDLDNMLEGFRDREQQLVEEVDMTHQKNNVLSNLLDLVTERAESTQRELEKYMRESTTKSGQERSISAASEGSIGSDEVFDKDKVNQKDWEVGAKKQEQLLKRIESLERLLAEERQKSSLDKKAEEEAELHLREREILQQELELCQRQLREANERIKELKERLEHVEEARGDMKDDYEKVTKELEEARGKKEVAGKSLAGRGKNDREPASWRWERQRMEEEIKEYKKKMEDNQARWKTAGEDKEKDTKLRENLEKELKEVKGKCEIHKKELADIKARLEELQETLKKKEAQWDKEKTVLENAVKAAEKETKHKDEVINAKDNIIKQKDDLVNKKDQALKDKDEEVSKKDSDLKKKEEEVNKKSKDIENLERQLKALKEEHANCSIHIKDKEKQIKVLGEDLRIRDERLKEKDDILEQLNRKLVEKQNEVSDMDNTIRTTMKKLQDKETEIKDIKSDKTKTDKSIKELKSKVKDLEKNLEAAKKELQTEMASMAVKKGKVESELSDMTKEKKALQDEVQDAKDKLKKKESKWKKEKDALELDLKKAKDKLSSLESTKGMKQSEAVKTLTGEKEQLVAENHKLSEELSKLKKDKKSQKKEFTEERDDLQKIISEKTKMVEDNSAICERMQKEIDSLKAQMQQAGITPSTSGKKLIPIPVQHETSKKTIPVIHETSSNSVDKVDVKSSKEFQELQDRLQTQEIMFEAEKASFKEKYDGQLNILEQKLNQSLNEMSALRKNNEKQRDNLLSARQSVSDLKSRYDSGVLTWKEDKKELEKKSTEIEEKRTKIVDLEKQLDELKNKLKQEETKAKDAANKLATEKSSWNADKLAMQNQIKKLEDQPASKPGPAKISEFRAKFEKFEKGPEVRRSSIGAKATSPVNSMDRDKVVDEANKVAKDLQKQLTEARQAHEKETKELQEKMDKLKKELNKDCKDLKDRNAKLEKKSSEFSDLEKSLVEIRQNMEEERSKWEKERDQLRKEMEESKKDNLQDKEKMNDLLAEVKKLQTMAPQIAALEESSSKSKKTEKKKKGSKSPEKEKEEVVTRVKVVPFGEAAKDSGKDDKDEGTKALDKPAKFFLQALEHISKLAAEVSRRASPSSNSRQQEPPVKHRSQKSGRMPLLFRRSLSTSEVEINPEKETFVYVGRPAPQEELLQPTYGSVAQAAPSPTILASTQTRPSRPRDVIRSQSTIADGEGDPFADVDRRVRPTGGGSGSNRASFYASGTMSATVSRETTPERLLASLRKPTKLPPAPPSMIITPSHTPRRAQSVERGAGDLSSKDMQRLYQKLSAIEKESEQRGDLLSVDSQRALMKERGRGLRILTKSTSVDNNNLETPSPQPPSSNSRDYSPLYMSNSAIPSAYDDASPSETLPASIRFGALVITPGIEKLTNAYRQKRDKDFKRSASVSPRSARKHFYEEYDRRNTASWQQQHSRASELDSDVSDAESFYETKSLGRPKKSPKSSKKSKDKKDKNKEPDAKKEKTFKLTPASFFESIREKRRLFGSKRAASVDNAAVRAEAARHGVSFLTHPGTSSSSSDPKDNQESKEAKEPKETKKKGLIFKRTGSVDTATLQSVSSKPPVPSTSFISSTSSKKPSTGGSTSSNPPTTASTSRASWSSDSDPEDDTEDGRAIPALRTVRFLDEESSIARHKSLKKACLRPVSMETHTAYKKKAKTSSLAQHKQSVELSREDLPFSETCV